MRHSNIVQQMECLKHELSSFRPVYPNPDPDAGTSCRRGDDGCAGNGSNAVPAQHLPTSPIPAHHDSRQPDRLRGNDLEGTGPHLTRLATASQAGRADSVLARSRYQSAARFPVVSGPRVRTAEALSKQAVRYWLATLTYQEALIARPKARRPVDLVTSTIHVEEPVAGQDYAKLPFAGAESFLVERRGEQIIDLGSEWCGFFEHWLAARYRRGDDEENNSRQLVSFPTLHLPSDELAGLLRFPVEVEWIQGERTFVVPTYAQRKRGVWPAPPVRARLMQPGSEPEQVLPFFIDGRVLRDTLRIDSERIDDFFTLLRERERIDAKTTVVAICELLEEQNAFDKRAMIVPQPQGPSVKSLGSRSRVAEPVTLLSRLLANVDERIALIQSRARVYGVALLLSADQTRATWHLQKDLHQVEDAIDTGWLDELSPLRAYLTGSTPRLGKRTCWGRWRGPGLTESQRAACEISLGSNLSAVQGPPGTGKTTLILNLLAHTLVQKVTVLAQSGKMGGAITVVTSTNNRAVDNVVEPLGRELDPHSLPLAIRAGSRQIIENVTLPELQRVRRWLQDASPAELQARPLLQTELRCFTELHSRIKERVSAEQLQHQRLQRKQEIEVELVGLRATLQSDGEDGETELARALHELATPPQAELDAAQQFAIADPANADVPESGRAIAAFLRETTRHAPVAVELRQLANRLEALSELLSAPRNLDKARRHFKQTKRRELARVQRALGFELLTRQLPPAPEPALVEDALEAWEEAAEWSLNAVRQLEQRLVSHCERARIQTKIEQLESELELLNRETAAAPPEISSTERAELDKQHLELFESAVRVREAWAKAHREDLSSAVDEAILVLKEARSFRSLMDKPTSETRWLRELFPAWGCTLLSLGNVFPPDGQCAEMVVIDEAGQCHPAYAVSALLRAGSALIIGDTNQLEPVVGLSVEDERRIVRGLDLEVEIEQLGPFRAYDGSMTSAQSLADRAFTSRPTLVDHFRCQPEISAICEALCHYGLVTWTPRRTRAGIAPLLSAPVLVAAVDGVQERFAGSWVNDAEAHVTMRIVRDLLASGIHPNEIGIITPYRGQLERLWRMLRELGVPVDRPSADVLDIENFERVGPTDRGLAAGTVHRFQGGERSIILFTTTVTTERSLRFVDERVNLVNVAASRARDHLITIGHAPTLRLGRHTRHLLDNAVPLTA